MMANRNTAHQTLPQILCRNIIFDGNLRKSDLYELERFLRLPDHRVVALNMTSTKFKQSEVNKVIKILSLPKLNNLAIDVFNLGWRKFSEKDLIIIGKWILNKFSTKVEENTFDIRRYLFSISEVDITDDQTEQQTSEEKERELRESSN